MELPDEDWKHIFSITFHSALLFYTLVDILGITGAAFIVKVKHKSRNVPTRAEKYLGLFKLYD